MSAPHTNNPMLPQVYQLTAEMSELMWLARVKNLPLDEVRNRYLTLCSQHLSQVDPAQSSEVQQELEQWGERIAQLFKPAFLEQAI